MNVADSCIDIRHLAELHGLLEMWRKKGSEWNEECLRLARRSHLVLVGVGPRKGKDCLKGQKRGGQSRMSTFGGSHQAGSVCCMLHEHGPHRRGEEGDCLQ